MANRRFKLVHKKTTTQIYRKLFSITIIQCIQSRIKKLQYNAPTALVDLRHKTYNSVQLNSPERMRTVHIVAILRRHRIILAAGRVHVHNAAVVVVVDRLSRGIVATPRMRRPPAQRTVPLETVDGRINPSVGLFVSLQPRAVQIVGVLRVDAVLCSAGGVDIRDAAIGIRIDTLAGRILGGQRCGLDQQDLQRIE